MTTPEQRSLVARLRLAALSPLTQDPERCHIDDAIDAIENGERGAFGWGLDLLTAWHTITAPRLQTRPTWAEINDRIEAERLAR